MRLHQIHSSDVEMAVRQARVELGEEAMLVAVEQAKSGDSKSSRYRVTFANQVIGAEKDLGSILRSRSEFLISKDTPKHGGNYDGWKTVRFELAYLAEQLAAPISYPGNPTPDLNSAVNYPNLRSIELPPGGQCTAIIGRKECGKTTAIHKLAFRETSAGRTVAVVRAFQPSRVFIPKLASAGVLQRNATSIAELDAVFEELSAADLILADISSVVADRNWPMSQSFRRWLMANGATLHLAIDATSPPSHWRSDVMQFSWLEPAYLLLSHMEKVVDWKELNLCIESTGLECSFCSMGATMDSPIEWAKLEQLIPTTKAASAN